MTPLSIALVALAAVGLSAFTYYRLEGLRRGILPAIAGRSVAWAALGLLLLNVSCPRPPVRLRPIVLLDASLSMTGAGGRWAEARVEAARLGNVRPFGDDRPGFDTLPDRGRSAVAAALAAASASDRPVIVVTDGEVDDARDLSAASLAGAEVRVFPRTAGHDVAIVGVTGPPRATAGDTVVLEADLRSFGAAGPDTVTMVAVDAGRRLAQRRTVLTGAARVELRVPTAGLGAGDHVLHVSIEHRPDVEPRTDLRLYPLGIVTTPGIVVLASPGDWDSRFLYRALKEVSALPVRGYVRLEPDRWRSMADLAPVPTEEVRRQASRADLLVLKGGTGVGTMPGPPRALWLWPSGEGGESVLPGDWYLTGNDASPVGSAFLGLPVDSFPPVSRITPMEAAPADWIGMTAQESRRGAVRPVVIGHDGGRVRRVTVAADGLWRWAIRGGASEQAYRAWVAATTSWLLAGGDSASGSARPVSRAVQNGRPVVFEWTAAGVAADLSVGWTATGFTRTDTLHFDGSGRAVAWLPPGEYRYRLGGGGGGAAVVETYSDEWLPRPVTMAARGPAHAPTAGRSEARDWIWLFAAAVAGLCAEWIARRRLGLR